MLPDHETPLVPLLLPGEESADAETLETWYLALSNAVSSDLPHDLLAVWLYPASGGVALIAPAALAADQLTVPVPPDITPAAIGLLEEIIRDAGYPSVMAEVVRLGDRETGLLLFAALREDVYGERGRAMAAGVAAIAKQLYDEGKLGGIIGMGEIGRELALRSLPFGMRLLYTQRTPMPAEDEERYGVEYAPLPELLAESDWVSVQLPGNASTENYLGREELAQMKPGAVVLNFSRGGVVEEVAILEALQTGQLSKYVCDFPDPQLAGQPGVILLPHLGASTQEAEENCAVMVVDQVRDYLLDGTIQNSVNFPDVILPRESRFRVAIANANVPNMVGGISHEMAAAGLNIATMTNKSRRDLAYTLVDVDSEVPDTVIKAISAIDGVLMVRYLPLMS